MNNAAAPERGAFYIDKDTTYFHSAKHLVVKIW